jgi:hypothetical protein
MGDYLQTARKLLKATAEQPDAILRGAHAAPDGQVPTKDRKDIQVLHEALVKIKSGNLKGTGAYPVIYAIDEGVVMQAEPSWLQNWKATYPDPVQ